MGEPSPEKSITDILSAMDSHRKQALDITTAQLNKDEFDFFEQKKQQTHLDLLTLQNEALQGVIQLRKEYSRNILRFLICWSAGVGLVLMFQGFKLWGFSLPESVLDFLVGSTTVNVIALVGLVVKGLFPERQPG